MQLHTTTAASRLSASRLLLALSLAFAGAGTWAQDSKAEDHAAHHPAEAASAPKPAAKPASPKPAAKPAPTKSQAPAMDKVGMEKMGQMDAKMKAMQDMHQKFIATKTPQERIALMPENMKTMQDAMSMMEDMRTNMGDKGGMGMGMMGGADGAPMMGKMPMMDMMAKHQMMEKRMDMMQSMMQMMMDRLQVPPTK